MVRLTFQDVTHPEDLAEDLDNMELLRRGTIRRFHMEKRLLRGDGSYMWAGLTVVPMWQAGEPPTYHLAMVEDVTERRAAEDKLRMRESQLSGILDHTTAVVYLKDRDGRYLLTNRRYQDLFQRSGESVVGKKDAEVFPETVAQKFRESDVRVWREQCPLDFEEAAPHADGLHTYRSVKFPVRDESGRMIALGGISTDITDLKQAHEALTEERELLRNLIEVQEKKKQFICHEFHDGLIQYAVGSLMLLEGCKSKCISPEVSETLDVVIGILRKGVEDGRRVIRGIRPAVLDDSGLDAAIEDLVGQYSTSGVLVTSNCDEKIGRLPNSVQTTVYRVVQEAVNNAIKHSGTDVVRIEMKKADGRLQLEVRDFGCGFNPESVRKKGFGLLGMTERVRLLGGECLIQSEADAGTRVSVRLPIPAADYEAN
jgi:PAS domain S-box-containing protein